MTDCTEPNTTDINVVKIPKSSANTVSNAADVDNDISLDTGECLDKGGPSDRQAVKTTDELELEGGLQKPDKQQKGRDDERKRIFESHLSILERCSTYTEIECFCSTISQDLDKYTMDDLYLPSIMDTKLHVDEDAMDLHPSDTPQTHVMYPVNVTADGNCLLYTGSILAFGNENYGTEIRVRIIVEAVLNRKLYLTHNYLCYGASSTGSKDLPKACAMYSDEYIPSTKLDESAIEQILNREIMKITKMNSYMGIWQMFALSSVLGRPLFSVYPNLGNAIVRNDLHRLIHPREIRSACISYVMWSSTRKDMTKGHWIPNHFVAVLPIVVDGVVKLGMQRWKLVRERRLEKERRTHAIAGVSLGRTKHIDIEIEHQGQKQIPRVDIERDEKQNIDRESEHQGQKQIPRVDIERDEKQNIDRDSEHQGQKQIPRVDIEGDEKQNIDCDSEHQGQKQIPRVDIEGDEKQNIDRDSEHQGQKQIPRVDIEGGKIEVEETEPMSIDLLSPEELVGKYVLVQYNSHIYPGIVLDSDEKEVYIRCMHRVGKTAEDFAFYWPKAVKDECWYEMEDVLRVIQEPTQVNRKYYVNKEILESVKRGLN
jgi:hypothetical protein